MRKALAESVRSLERHGFRVTVSVDGDLDPLPRALVPTLRAVIGEVCANIEQHGDPREPAAIIMSVSDQTIDAIFLNQTRDEPATSAAGLGLQGVRERLALVNGELAAEREGSQWISRLSVPL